jgi:glycosyltransferase involved in cell wall biosynthesis
MKKTLVILTLNEIEGLNAIFDKIPLDAADEVFAVDGGSTDGTCEFLRLKNVCIVTQDKKGRGEAFRVAVAAGSGEVFCFFSPDGNEDPADIPRLFAAVEAGADMAIARRFGKDARNEEDDAALPLRAWANRMFGLLANLFFNRGPFVKDTINGYRAITRRCFNSLNLDAQGFLIEYQMSIRAMKLGSKIVEIPTVESPRIGGQSTATSIPTGLKFLRGLLHEIFIGKNCFCPKKKSEPA